LEAIFAGTVPRRPVLVFAMQSPGQIDFEELDAALQSAPALSTRLFRKVLQGCTRLESLRQLGRVAALDELAKAEAWTDATLRLLELELPNWVVRRLIREGDDWLCTLSRQPNLPIALDDPVEGVHATLPLAILRALVDARRRLSTEVRPASWIPQIRPASGIPVCCDNFA
jgi:hypothetical protein